MCHLGPWKKVFVAFNKPNEKINAQTGSIEKQKRLESFVLIYNKLQVASIFAAFSVSVILPSM